MRGRFLFLFILAFLLFGILLFRLFDLTVIKGSFNRQLADEQRIRIRKITAPRGIIFDRQGKPLVRNTPIFKVKENERVKTISREEALKMEAKGKEADLMVGVGREYLYGEAMAHLLGYLGEVTQEEISNKGSFGYKLGDLVGRTGIEQQYDYFLRGIDGGELVEVDTHGLILRKIGKREPIPGRDLFLSIDIDLQQTAYEALGGKKGTVVVSSPRTGEILALVSSPSFDPNLFVQADQGKEERKIREILENPDKPMFNRAISGAYPPGSTFKIVTSAAGLEEGKITEETKIEDPGQIVIGKYRFANWYFTKYGKTEGVISLVRAIARSTDTFFYKVGEWVGAGKLVEWGKAFGLARASGIDLPGEIEGFLPDPSSGPPAGGWFLGNTYHLSIGQGFLGLTPLQVNMMTQVVADGGKLCQPKISTAKKEDCKSIGLKKETIKLISEGMKQACSPGGTAGAFFNFVPQVACKTGTAEFDDPAGRTHAWLTAFAPAGPEPAEGPEIVVTALVEAGGEGSTVAAPIAKKVLEEYFR